MATKPTCRFSSRAAIAWPLTSSAASSSASSHATIPHLKLALEQLGKPSWQTVGEDVGVIKKFRLPEQKGTVPFHLLAHVSAGLSVHLDCGTRQTPLHNTL